jgi:hypothetical protein
MDRVLISRDQDARPVGVGRPQLVQGAEGPGPNVGVRGVTREGDPFLERPPGEEDG